MPQKIIFLDLPHKENPILFCRFTAFLAWGSVVGVRVWTNGTRIPSLPNLVTPLFCLSSFSPFVLDWSPMIFQATLICQDFFDLFSAESLKPTIRAIIVFASAPLPSSSLRKHRTSTHRRSLGRGCSTCIRAEAWNIDT